MQRTGSRLAPLLVVASTLACGGDPGPEIVRFTATPSAVHADERAVLTYEVRGANRVQIDGERAAVLGTTAMTSGTVTTPPLSASATFTLSAEGGGSVARRSLTVEVLPGEAAARIRSFQSSVTEVTGDQSFTLEWATEHAVAGALRVGQTVLATLSSNELASGARRIARISRPTTYTLAVRAAADGPEVTKEVTVGLIGPVVSVFAASPNPVRRGRSATLTWLVEDATSVNIRGNQGAAVATDAPLAGSALVTPAFDELYTLVAQDDAGHTTTATLSVSVTALRSANVLSFTATPSTVRLGGRVTLTWAVEDATDGVRLTTGTGAVVTATTAQAGSVIVAPEVSTRYVLTARNAADGDDTATVAVTVEPFPPTILTFTAAPNPAPLVGPVRLAWTTDGGASLSLRRGPAEVYATTTEVDHGALELTPGAAAESFVLVVTNSAGQARATVDVYAHDLPTIGRFDVAPRALVGPGTVSVSWSVTNVERLTLTANGAPLTGFVPVNNSPRTATSVGNLQVPVSARTHLELVASSAAGAVTSAADISLVLNEAEPNGGAAAAMALDGSDGVRGALGTGGDEDWYSVQVPAGSSLYAETSNGQAGCAVDTYLELVAPDGSTVLAADDDGGYPITGSIAGCSRIDWRTRAAARTLSGGRYYLHVRGSAPTDAGAYTLTVSVDAPGCGNGYVESLSGRPPEQCDDGNTTSGDGCSASCTVEPLQTLVGPASQRTLTGAVRNAYDVDYYALTLQAPGYLRAETFAPLAPSCPDADTILRLYDAAFGLLGEDDEDGVLGCSRIDPTVDAFAALSAGTYYLSVGTVTSAPIATYALVVELIGQGCGNGLLEAQEGCDDGNVFGGDGCDASCQPEGTPEQELFGNDGPLGNGLRTARQDALFHGSIDPVGDEDWYALVLPTGGAHLDAAVSVGGLSTCPEGSEVRLTLYAADGVTLLASDAYGGAEGRCGRIAPATTPAAFAPAPGLYFLRVNKVGDDAVLPSYFLDVAFLAPGCGNGVREGLEGCDDGNVSSGDGCDAICALELFGAPIASPGATRTVTFGPGGGLAGIALDLSAPGSALAAVAASPGGTSCLSVDTALELLDATYTRLGRAAAGGPSGPAGTCAALSIAEGAFGTDLPAGRYYLVVHDENRAAGTVELRVTLADPLCGDGLQATLAGELCDDGNTTAADGCGSSCALEPRAILGAPTNGPVLFTGSLTFPGARDGYRVDVTGGDVYLDAETFSPDVASGCIGVDTILRVHDASAQLVASMNQGGQLNCAHLRFTDPGARLSPGTYWLTVGELADDAPIGAYELRVEARDTDRCGNGVLEAQEGCDDGNGAAGDGCSPTCVLEGGPPINEREPNDGAALSQLLPTPALPSLVDVSALAGRGITEDWFRFTVPAGQGASGLIFTYGVLGTPASCSVDAQLWLYSGVPTNLAETVPGASEPTLVAFDDNDGFGSCPQVSGTDTTPARELLSPGTYYVRVHSLVPTGTGAGYVLRIDLR